MKYAYYPGCSALGTSADYELSTRVVCKDLGINLQDLEDWNCCGSTPAHAVDTELSGALCVRNLDLAAKSGAEKVLTPCPSCLSNLRAARKHMEDDEFRGRVDELLDAPTSPELPQAYSVMQILTEAYDAELLQNRAARQFKDIKLAPYYGCLMSRPAELMQFGHPENPQAMEKLLGACGADVLDFPLKTYCCGASFGIPERSVTANLSGKILQLAKNLQADALVVCCPLCQMNLDLRQAQAAKAMGTKFNIPVLYFTQVLGLAFGHSPESLGIDKLCVSADALIKKLSDAQIPATPKDKEARS